MIRRERQKLLAQFQEHAVTDQPDPANNQPPGYVPPKVWTWDKANGGAVCQHQPPDFWRDA